MKPRIPLDPVRADAVEQLTGVEPDRVEELDGAGGDEDELLPDLGEVFGVSYDLAEELFCGEKEYEHDRHRWELDPASSEDYAERSHLTPGAWRWRHFSH